MDEELAEELALALELEELDDVPDDGGRGMAAEGGVMLEPIDEAEAPALPEYAGGAIAGGAMPIDEAEALELELAIEPEDDEGTMAEGGVIALADAAAEAIALA